MGSHQHSVDHLSPKYHPNIITKMSSETENCQLCLSPLLVLTVGECDHPVCLTCSTRMRVLCLRNECALCRRDLQKVVATRSRAGFSELENKVLLTDRKYRICFESAELESQYRELVAHRCPLCPPDRSLFPSFPQLERHVRRAHSLHYCQLCLDNTNLFTAERKLYSRSDLASHRRREHPECKFCGSRYFDEEELFKHCRKDHFFCHICEANGLQNIFAEYSDLRKHFGRDHYPCTDPACEDQKFVVFKNEIDWKAHQVSRHGASYRNLDLAFNCRRGRKFDTEDNIIQEAERRPNNLPNLVSDFPQIDGSDSRPVFTLSSSSWSQRTNNKLSNQNAEDFPSLPSV